MIKEQTTPTIAPYAKTGEVHPGITAKAESEKECEKMIKPMVAEVQKCFGDNIFAAEESKSLEETVVDLLREQELTLSLVESCTGGMISARIVNVAGASDVFMNGFVTYSNDAKHKLVGVKKKTLEKKGAVSKKCAKQMAKGGRLVSGTDVCLSVTGIAGPDGGTEEKPVGTVFIGCSFFDKTIVKECHFNGNRSRIREQTTAHALVFLRSCIMEWLAEDE